MAGSAPLGGAGGAPELSAGRPHVWVIDVRDAGFEALADRSLCSESEEARASRLQDPGGRRLSLARRAALRITLGRYLGIAPDEVRLVIAPGGKPTLVPRAGEGDHRPLAFSVGHSGDLYCIGIAADASVGIDVERLRPIARAHAIAARWFGADEAATLEGLEGVELDRAFMDLWTSKEALAKRHGAGLRLMRGQAAEPEVRAALDVWTERSAGRLRGLELADGYVGAFASRSPIEGVRIIAEQRW